MVLKNIGNKYGIKAHKIKEFSSGRRCSEAEDA